MAVHWPNRRQRQNTSGLVFENKNISFPIRLWAIIFIFLPGSIDENIIYAKQNFEHRSLIKSIIHEKCTVRNKGIEECMFRPRL